ncbi:MAG: 30S ribosomal protein S16 [Candidatus Portnoybacteria bacterium CG10_big_fil_rev_8_21_14_0_10_36_7]|uniref:Small ribosomal subunit protein bS16 n=1 Tax=Candidatus Portnoybacteria bacterium CG10_big_fil_rev_8_21_14_0_10_36_7 TaxID=1974812 RepID=A0A2M8KEU8_9BACT|nr:MAG: 30S ribosomal protein S16 [Candidatus Portnoybacteria bacterium CG10_big_fil_rev_8_21_14_0_10_36_7]
MLKIRLTRVGKKNSPAFRVILVESARASKTGKDIELLGYYEPRHKKTELKKERILFWLSRGAQSSPTVHNLLVKNGVIDAKKVKSFRPKKKDKDAKPKEEPVAKAE